MISARSTKTPQQNGCTNQKGVGCYGLAIGCISAFTSESQFSKSPTEKLHLLEWNFLSHMRLQWREAVSLRKASRRNYCQRDIQNVARHFSPSTHFFILDGVDLSRLWVPYILASATKLPRNVANSDFFLLPKPILSSFASSRIPGTLVGVLLETYNGRLVFFLIYNGWIELAVPQIARPADVSRGCDFSGQPVVREFLLLYRRCFTRASLIACWGLVSKCCFVFTRIIRSVIDSVCSGSSDTGWSGILGRKRY